MRSHLAATCGLVAVCGVLATGLLIEPRLRAMASQDQIIIGQGAAGQPAQRGAEPAKHEFEVASVKPNKTGGQGAFIRINPATGRFDVTNFPLRGLIRNAYQLQDFQLVGGPDWIASDRFDIVAKAEGAVPQAAPGTAGPLQLMIRSLLTERFKLKVHSETRDMPIYSLVLARADGKLGPQLRPSTVDCAAMAAAARGRGGPPAPPPPGERPVCGMRIGPGTMAGGGFPLSQLVVTLSQFAQRVVIDRTGLTGNFDLDLTWAPDPLQQGPPGGAPAGAPPPPPSDGPSLFTALQEQLGLKLDSARGPVEVLVIDSVEQPTAD